MARRQRLGAVVWFVRITRQLRRLYTQSTRNNVAPGYQMDHVIDLQLNGCSNRAGNIRPAPARVNQSFGAQISNQIGGRRGLPISDDTSVDSGFDEFGYQSDFGIETFAVKKAGSPNATWTRDAFTLAYGYLSANKFAEAKECLRCIASIQYDGKKHDMWFFTAAARFALRTTGDNVVVPSPIEEQAVLDQRAVPEVGMLMTIQGAIRNCAPPHLDWQYNVSTLAQVIAFAWFHAYCGFAQIGNFKLNQLADDYTRRLGLVFWGSGA